MKRSRIGSKYKKKSQKTLILSVLGMLLVFILIFKFGIPFIVTVGSFFEGASKSEINQEDDFLATPTLDNLPDATNKRKIEVSGYSSSNAKVEIFISGDIYDDTSTGDDGSFSLDIDLSEGNNIIKARAKRGDKQSEFSDSQTVVYRNSPPSLTIDSPTDGSTVNTENITVSGKTDDEVSVTVNDFWAVINPDNGYSYVLKLSSGENKIKVVAIDEAGNKTEKEIKVTYSP